MRFGFVIATKIIERFFTGVAVLRDRVRKFGVLVDFCFEILFRKNGRCYEE
ncbi:MAG: hypothetical protein NMNS01_07660 [Nitrosomonas sp.]|nr:MAG: hypothetical protein NMNS01_07660 [Nitrosomonas sp.]